MLKIFCALSFLDDVYDYPLFLFAKTQIHSWRIIPYTPQIYCRWEKNRAIFSYKCRCWSILIFRLIKQQHNLKPQFLSEIFIDVRISTQRPRPGELPRGDDQVRTRFKYINSLKWWWYDISFAIIKVPHKI